jgi:hypothetical protein
MFGRLSLTRSICLFSILSGLLVVGSGIEAGHQTAPSRKVDPRWAYTALHKPEAPHLKLKQPANAIDAFIERGLLDLGLEAAPAADRHTLIRRATLDLTGLPPTLEEVDSFVRDSAPDREAFGRVVERLLASPRYGEQWARHWLDVVRYADSSGLANDYERPNAWRYRDYVIRAFNQDKPYDRFVREQIAGDEIAPEDPEMLIAVGFLRMGPWELTGMEVPRVARQGFLDDVTDAVGQVFLSHPLQCARCHDHKFDPIPTRDYYGIQAVFATTQFAERDARFLDSENTAGFEERRSLEARIARDEATVNQIQKKEEDAGRKWCAERGLEYVPRREALKRGMPEDRIAPRHIGLTAEDLGIERIARKNLTRLRWELDRYRPIAFSVYSGRTPELRSVDSRLKMPANPEADGTLEQTAILAGGDPFSPTTKVTPGTLSAVPNGKQPKLPDSVAGRRKAFADWIATPHNALAARSMVNRIWQYHFGRGISATPNNFGRMGGSPSHPELLDWLASSFIEKDWSVKAMHRLIMDSEAYRRAAAHPDMKRVTATDPENTSYAVFKPRRLMAEELRDSMLAISGELNLEMGGIPTRPEISLEAALQPRQIMGTYAPAYQPSPLPRQRHRRSIYTLRLRGLGNPFMEVFNQPSPDLSCERRETSTVTPQVFTLFNSEDSYRRALALAARLTKETKGKGKAIERAFRLVYGRLPAEDEARASLEHWKTMTARHRTLKFLKRDYPKRVVREAVEENTGEKFKFAEELDVYESFVPDLDPAEAGPAVRGLAEVCLVLFNSNEFIYVY